MRIRIVGGSNTWRGLQQVALAILGFVVLLSITGILLTGNKPSPKPRPNPVAVPAPAVTPAPPPLPVTTPTPVEQSPSAPPPAATKEEPVKPPVPAPAPAVAAAKPRASSEPRVPRLRGTGSVVVLATTESDAEDLREHPDKLEELVQNGSLFTVPNDTQVEILETRPGLLQVRVQGGPSDGKEGWVRTNQVLRPR